MKIYVVTHKETEVKIEDNLHVPIAVGGRIDDKFVADNAMLRDNAGDSISDKNDIYNELTAMYWVWKNSTEDIVGICHYRRYFVKPFGKVCDLIDFKNHNAKFPIDQSYILGKLDRYDLITHNITVLPMGNRQHFERTFDRAYMDIVREVIRDRCPDYTESFDEVMKSRTVHFLNMLICRKELYDEYCEWLFDILFEAESRLRNKNLIMPRIMGMIAERMLDVYIRRNGLRISGCYSVNTEHTDWKQW